MTSLAIREFQSAITSFINQTYLPLEVKRLCLCEIMKELEDSTNEMIKHEITVRDSKDSQKESEVVEDAESL